MPCIHFWITVEYFTAEQQLFSQSLVSWCLKGKMQGGIWLLRKKHRPEKIHFNLPNASAGLLTFSNWYFPWNSIVSLYNSIIQPLVDSDYTQHDCSHSEIWAYMTRMQYMWGSERIRWTDWRSTSSAGRGEQTVSPVSFSTWLNRRPASADIFLKVLFVKEMCLTRKLVLEAAGERKQKCTLNFQVAQQ